MKIELQQLDAIIFDLGGVLLRINYQMTISAFQKLGLVEVPDVFSQNSQSGFFDDFETGRISPAQFRGKIRSFSSTFLSDTEIDAAWNGMLLDFPESRLAFLEKIRTEKRIFLLSNTNEIHMKWFRDYMDSQFGSNRFFTLFEKAYLSNELGMRKPNLEIFDHVIHMNGLNPSRTLFIDDTQQHIFGARKAGLQALLLPKHVDIQEVF